MLRVRPVFLAFAALALGTGALTGATADGARAHTAKLCGYQTAAVAGGGYTVQNNEWGSSASECITTNGHAQFRVANSAISDPSDGAPGGYPSIFTGCHWGNCSKGGLAAHPLLLAGLGREMVASNWYTTQPNGSQDIYDVAYDIWINRTATTSGSPDGTEVMVWINHHGPVQPAGNLIAIDARIGRHHYDIWYNPGSGAGDGVSYEMMHAHTGVTDLDIDSVIYDAERRGYTDPSWYLISVEAGFEIWRGGAGLATKSFSVSLSGRIQPLRSPAGAGLPASLAARICSLVAPRARNCSGVRVSMRSLRTAATWPGAVATTFCQPSSVRTALMKRPSPGHGSRRTQPLASRRLTTCDSRESELLASAASSLMRRVRSAASDRPDRTR
jgi:hypothetical protein